MSVIVFASVWIRQSCCWSAFYVLWLSDCTTGMIFLQLTEVMLSSKLLEYKLWFAVPVSLNWQKFTIFETLRLVTMSARHWISFWARWLHSATSQSLRFVLILTFYWRFGLLKVSFTLGFQKIILLTFVTVYRQYFMYVSAVVSVLIWCY